MSIHITLPQKQATNDMQWAVFTWAMGLQPFSEWMPCKIDWSLECTVHNSHTLYVCVCASLCLMRIIYGILKRSTIFETRHFRYALDDKLSDVMVLSLGILSSLLSCACVLFCVFGWLYVNLYNVPDIDGNCTLYVYDYCVRGRRRISIKAQNQHVYMKWKFNSH